MEQEEKTLKEKIDEKNTCYDLFFRKYMGVV
jgi:hypothetical protein